MKVEVPMYLNLIIYFVFYVHIIIYLCNEYKTYAMNFLQSTTLLKVALKL